MPAHPLQKLLMLKILRDLNIPKYHSSEVAGCFGSCSIINISNFSAQPPEMGPRHLVRGHSIAFLHLTKKRKSLVLGRE